MQYFLNNSAAAFLSIPEIHLLSSLPVDANSRVPLLHREVRSSLALIVYNTLQSLHSPNVTILYVSDAGLKTGTLSHLWDFDLSDFVLYHIMTQSSYAYRWAVCTSNTGVWRIMKTYQSSSINIRNWDKLVFPVNFIFTPLG